MGLVSPVVAAPVPMNAPVLLRRLPTALTMPRPNILPPVILPATLALSPDAMLPPKILPVVVMLPVLDMMFEPKLAKKLATLALL